MRTIIVADQQPIVRVGITQVISSLDNRRAVMEVADGHQLLNVLGQTEADVVITELSLPGLGGIEMIRMVREGWPDLPVLVFTALHQPEIATNAIRAGATGYLTKNSGPDLLLAAVQTLTEGGRFIAPWLAQSLLFDDVSGLISRMRRLSRRELQVLRLLAQGHSITQIADAFALSAKTVSTHKMRLMDKLGIRNNADLVRYAIQQGIVH